MIGARALRAGAVAWLVAAAFLASPAGAKGPKPLARGVPVSAAALDVARALGFARVGVARPDRIAPVRFADAKVLPEVSGGLVRGGFGLSRYSVLRDAPVAGQPNVRAVTGLLGHSDLFGRTEWSDFAAGFVVQGREITIQRAHVAPYHPLVPTVRFSFVRVADAPEKFLGRRYTSVSLLRFLYEAAVPASEIQAGEYYVVAAFMDRLQRKAKVRFTTGPEPEAVGGQGKGKLIVADDGWFALGRRMQIDPGAAPTWLKAVVIPPKHDALVASRLSTAELGR